MVAISGWGATKRVPIWTRVRYIVFPDDCRLQTKLKRGVSPGRASPSSSSSANTSLSNRAVLLWLVIHRRSTLIVVYQQTDPSKVGKWQTLTGRHRRMSTYKTYRWLDIGVCYTICKNTQWRMVSGRQQQRMLIERVNTEFLDLILRNPRSNKNCWMQEALSFGIPEIDLLILTLLLWITALRSCTPLYLYLETMRSGGTVCHQIAY